MTETLHNAPLGDPWEDGVRSVEVGFVANDSIEAPVWTEMTPGEWRVEYPPGWTPFVSTGPGDGASAQIAMRGAVPR